MSCEKFSVLCKDEAYRSTLPLHSREGPVRRDQYEVDTNQRTSC
jgi:hypothetical protein